VSLDRLVISKGYIKEEEDYTAKQTHVELAKRMARRDPASAPALGDRVPYVVRPGRKGQRVHELTEDPLHMIEHDLQYGPAYYVEKQLRRPVTRVLGPVIGKDAVQALFCGDHARSVSRRAETDRDAGGAIERFCEVTERCRCCKEALFGAPVSAVVCAACRGTPEHGALAAACARELADVEEAHAGVMRTCAECRAPTGGSAEDRCSTRECPVLYQRAALRKRVIALRRVVDDGGAADRTAPPETGPANKRARSGRAVVSGPTPWKRLRGVGPVPTPASARRAATDIRRFLLPTAAPQESRVLGRLPPVTKPNARVVDKP
jgi:DNA polymerase delta subunit 1